MVEGTKYSLCLDIQCWSENLSQLEPIYSVIVCWTNYTDIKVSIAVSVKASYMFTDVTPNAPTHRSPLMPAPNSDLSSTPGEPLARLLTSWITLPIFVLYANCSLNRYLSLSGLFPSILYLYLSSYILFILIAVVLHYVNSPVFIYSFNCW